MAGVAPNRSSYNLEVDLFIRSNRGDFLSDRLGSWRLVFLSDWIMEIFCWISSWITFCLFVGCEHEGFLLDYFVNYLLSFVSVRSWIFLIVLLNYILLFLERCFLRIWRGFLRSPIYFGRCGMDYLFGGPQGSPFCQI